MEREFQRFVFRESTRTVLQAKVKLQFATSEDYSSHLGNLSAGGMFVSMADPKPVGTLLRFEIFLDGLDQRLKGFGEVAWIRAKAPSPDLSTGMGIQFRHMNEPGLDLLKERLELAERGDPSALKGPGSKTEELAAVALDEDATGDSTADSTRADADLEPRSDDDDPGEQTDFNLAASLADEADNAVASVQRQAREEAESLLDETLGEILEPFEVTPQQTWADEVDRAVASLDEPNFKLVDVVNEDGTADLGGVQSLDSGEDSGEVSDSTLEGSDSASHVVASSAAVEHDDLILRAAEEAVADRAELEDSLESLEGDAEEELSATIASTPDTEEPEYAGMGGFGEAEESRGSKAPLFWAAAVAALALAAAIFLARDPLSRWFEDRSGDGSDQIAQVNPATEEGGATASPVVETYSEEEDPVGAGEGGQSASGEASEPETPTDAEDQPGQAVANDPDPVASSQATPSQDSSTAAEPTSGTAVAQNSSPSENSGLASTNGETLPQQNPVATPTPTPTEKAPEPSTPTSTENGSKEPDGRPAQAAKSDPGPAPSSGTASSASDREPAATSTAQTVEPGQSAVGNTSQRNVPIASPGDLTALSKIEWEERSGNLVFVLTGNGTIPRPRWRRVRLNDRLVLKLTGIQEPYARNSMQVPGPHVTKLRTGHHRLPNTRELHLVFDLVGPGSVLREIYSEADKLYLIFGPKE